MSINLHQIDNFTDSHEFAILKNMIPFEQALPIFLNISKFYTSLLTASMTLKDFIQQDKYKKKTFDLEERHVNMDENVPNKISFLTTL